MGEQRDIGQGVPKMKQLYSNTKFETINTLTSRAQYSRQKEKENKHYTKLQNKEIINTKKQIHEKA